VRRRVAIIGGGEEARFTALRMAALDLLTITVFDHDAGRAEGIAEDVNAAAALGGYEPRVEASGRAESIAGSQLVAVATAAEEVRGAAGAIARHAPSATVVVLSSPVGPMCHMVLDTTRFTRQRVIGVGALVAWARARGALSMGRGVSVRDVEVPGPGGEPDDVERLAPVAAAAAAGEIVEAIVRDARRVLPCTVLCRGELGVDGRFAAVPALIGAAGVERIVEVERP
jgi:malate dehydrogenase